MFLLDKWYVDCVSEAGAALVGYWARMRWGLLTLPYAATLHSPADGAPRERYSIRRCDAPRVEAGELRWECERLDLRGRWTPGAPPVLRTLLDTPEGSIRWNCRFPRAGARVDLAGAGSVSGLGYAEQLTLSIKPWKLPFDELRWGRFLSAQDAVTWIDWRGLESRQWVFHNGQELSGASITTESVKLPDDRGTIEMRDTAVLREGRLMSTALRAIPGASLWLPRAVRNMEETKWLSRGALATPTHASSGWVIHEVVRWR